jgi:hypothetical protein
MLSLKNNLFYVFLLFFLEFNCSNRDNYRDAFNAFFYKLFDFDLLDKNTKDDDISEIDNIGDTNPGRYFKYLERFAATVERYLAELPLKFSYSNEYYIYYSQMAYLKIISIFEKILKELSKEDLKDIIDKKFILKYLIVSLDVYDRYINMLKLSGEEYYSLPTYDCYRKCSYQEDREKKIKKHNKEEEIKSLYNCKNTILDNFQNIATKEVAEENFNFLYHRGNTEKERFENDIDLIELKGVKKEDKFKIYYSQIFNKSNFNPFMQAVNDILLSIEIQIEFEKKLYNEKKIEFEKKLYNEKKVENLEKKLNDLFYFVEFLIKNLEDLLSREYSDDTKKDYYDDLILLYCYKVDVLSFKHILLNKNIIQLEIKDNARKAIELLEKAELHAKIRLKQIASSYKKKIMSLYLKKKDIDGIIKFLENIIKYNKILYLNMSDLKNIEFCEYILKENLTIIKKVLSKSEQFNLYNKIIILFINYIDIKKNDIDKNIVVVNNIYELMKEDEIMPVSERSKEEFYSNIKNIINNKQLKYGKYNLGFLVFGFCVWCFSKESYIFKNYISNKNFLIFGASIMALANVLIFNKNRLKPELEFLKNH